MASLMPWRHQSWPLWTAWDWSRSSFLEVFMLSVSQRWLQSDPGALWIQASKKLWSGFFLMGTSTLALEPGLHSSKSRGRDPVRSSTCQQLLHTTGNACVCVEAMSCESSTRPRLFSQRSDFRSEILARAIPWSIALEVTEMCCQDSRTNCDTSGRAGTGPTCEAYGNGEKELASSCLCSSACPAASQRPYNPHTELPWQCPPHLVPCPCREGCQEERTWRLGRHGPLLPQ